MARGRSLALFLILSLVVNTFSAPTVTYRRRRSLKDNKVDSKETSSTSVTKNSTEDSKADDAKTTTVAIDEDKSLDDDDDDDFDHQVASPPAGGGSNIFSLLNLASALFPASSGSQAKTIKLIKRLMQDLVKKNRSHIRVADRRQDIADNVIDIDYTTDLKPPPFQKQEIDETSSSDSSESESNDSDEVNGGEEADDDDGGNNEGNKSKQDDSDGGDDNDNDSDDYDEPPEGDGQGGGILGLLAGLSGDGDSDLGSLLATVGGIVANLSGDGVDINAIIATGLGLFIGLLSEGAQNPGEIIASYLLTSLDTITGGGAKNNGAFFGKFLATLVKGTSAADDPDGDSGSEENKMTMADSAGFFASLLMGLLGEMSKTSSGGSWR